MDSRYCVISQKRICYASRARSHCWFLFVSGGTFLAEHEGHLSFLRQALHPTQDRAHAHTLLYAVGICHVEASMALHAPVRPRAPKSESMILRVVLHARGRSTNDAKRTTWTLNPEFKGASLSARACGIFEKIAAWEICLICSGSVCRDRLHLLCQQCRLLMSCQRRLVLRWGHLVPVMSY